MRSKLLRFLIYSMIVIGCAQLCWAAEKAAAPYEIGRGKVLRYYEERSGDWASYVLLKDPLGKEQKYYVNAVLTLVKRGPEVQKIGDVTGGDNIVVLYRMEGKKPLASMIQIEDLAHSMP